MATTSSTAGHRNGNYSDLASEYYDSERHPTCANFREASQYLLVPWLKELVLPRSRVLETGAGSSIVAEWLASDKRLLTSFVASDLSSEMLHYSSSHSDTAAFVVCDAESLPFANNSLDLVVASLGDPYNTARFWREAARTLRSGGHVLFTTPAFEWARQFRNGANFAEFVTANGGAVAVTSWVEPEEGQRRMIERCELRITQRRDVYEYQLRETRRSPKLRIGPIVSGYVARKD
jgi:ubiquinone/menaquinone biosynthesis C-methylase UbiE